jgi:hypothetical protein
MLELRLNITESKILHSYKNNGNIKHKVFISNSANLKKPFKVDCYLPCKSTKVKALQLLMLSRRKHITENRTVLRYEKSGNKLDLLSITH